MYSSPKVRKTYGDLSESTQYSKELTPNAPFSYFTRKAKIVFGVVPSILLSEGMMEMGLAEDAGKYRGVGIQK